MKYENDMYNVSKVLIDEKEIEHIVSQLGEKITKDYKGRELVVVGILKGSFMFLADLVRHIDVPVYIDFLGLSSYGDATKSSGIVKITRDFSHPIDGKDVLIVEDIIDTGLTIKYLMENIKTRNPKSVEICTLLYKTAKADTDVPIKYIGKKIEDFFVVGYGLDVAGQYRHLPYIGIVEKNK